MSNVSSMSDNMDFLDDYDFQGSRSELVELAFDTLVRETDKAWCLKFPMKKDLTNDQHWFPKSQCDLEPDVNRIWVPRWLVNEKNCENYEV